MEFPHLYIWTDMLRDQDATLVRIALISLLFLASYLMVRWQLPKVLPTFRVASLVGFYAWLMFAVTGLLR